MKNFDYTSMDEMPLLDSELPAKQSILSRITSTFSRKKKPTDTMPDDTTEPLLDDNEAAELKQMIESLTAPSPKSGKSSYSIPKIVTDVATPAPLPYPTPQPRKPWVRFANTIIVVIAFLAGMYGVIVLYNQFPTHPTIIVGIVAIAASSGVVTSITARG